jgi:hypothetical protein
MAPCEPIEATVARNVKARARVGVKLRRASLPEEDVATEGGFRVTTGLRTARDLGSRADLFESVVAIDTALREGLVELSTLASWVSCNPGAKGVKRLRRGLELANPLAESPMATRLRLELVTAGLPSPSVQMELRDAHGDFLGRVDMYYADTARITKSDWSKTCGAKTRSSMLDITCSGSPPRIFVFEASWHPRLGVRAICCCGRP